ncbi:MAG: hypothetical protein JW750_08525 [Anaerolineaceae bacterium]|nr:hypothetical protein [Anaerolineaceae bacterium]
MLEFTDIQRMTAEADDGWGMPHFHRLEHLIPLIAAGRAYDQVVLNWAIYLHDWGAFSRYALPGVDHALRSRQVVEAEILPRADFSDANTSLLLDVITHHDYRDLTEARAFEVQLFREADYLDFLGAVGMAREFAWGPADLSMVAKRIRARMDGIRGRFTLPMAQQMAEARLTEMEQFLASLRAQGFGTI